MKKIVFINLLIISLFSCKNETKKESKNLEQSIEKNLNCDNILVSLIKNSSISNPFKSKIKAEIDKKEDNKITVRLFVESESGTNIENSIGWLIIDVAKRKLFDITNDIENPVELKFNPSDFDFFLKCENLNAKNTTMENTKIDFNELFNEGSNIDFTPKDLNKDITEIKEFKSKLILFENSNPENFDSGNLETLINNETFTNSESFINGEWLDYFIKKYKLNVSSLHTLMSKAIEQEDFSAVKTLAKNGYIFNIEELESSKEQLKYFKSLNGKIDVENYYDPSYSHIEKIFNLINKAYQNYIIYDKDGYTNLREDKSINSKVITKINSGENINVITNPDEEDWCLVETKDGKKGYVHKSRIVSK
ncbi:hypothetical protein AX766_05500 [Flavobacterium covae]|uniref:SH3 domain-containing protein n=1 Tax=Flavobacterium covae TaxID=2906076 RepID=A0ABW8PJG4_9FLAO|nr:MULTISPECIES: SH3 domain-containing protein [Flavobacterium]AND63911.1 hypothetical protein AX766_05500 [Flavobacterium covae]OXA80463.1 SH3 domain-containing protein [Flavobacterium columnare NBRC 100251 = ATCC 23463]